ncbi:MAG: hypothetical protein WBV72_11380 [Nitrososphaeraceae archaeon]
MRDDRAQAKNCWSRGCRYRREKSVLNGPESVYMLDLVNEKLLPCERGGSPAQPLPGSPRYF